MPLSPQPLFGYLHALLLSVLIAALAACNGDDESQMDEYRRLYPIPTELPAATCTGANTVGCYVDSILFVANYFPNLSSWGGQDDPDGVRAFIERDGDDYIQVIAKHSIRPFEIDNRRMRLDMWWSISGDSLTYLRFTYVKGLFDIGLLLDDKYESPALDYEISYDQQSSTFCGIIQNARMAESYPDYIGDKSVYDTLTLRDFRIDVPVRQGRY